MEAEMDWQRLARANTHPLRISVLEVLALDGGRTLSPSDLSYELRVPLSNVNYHVTELVKSRLIELTRQRQVRGATEHFYRLVDHAANGAGRTNGASGNGHHPEERTTGLEPATSSLGSSRSTN
jgi:predicted ArsR family transcriptional regulator